VWDGGVWKKPPDSVNATLFTTDSVPTPSTRRTHPPNPNLCQSCFVFP
jgi:hypothetical protein